MKARERLEEEKGRLEAQEQELEKLICGEKEGVAKKNVSVEQMQEYLGYGNLTREMLRKYVDGIYVYDDGKVVMEMRAT